MSSALFRACICLFVLVSASHAEVPKPWPPPKPTKHDYSKWEKAVSAFEEADKKSPPAKGSVLFVGSSTIVRWKSLAQDFPELKVLNRGFGGNQIKDSTHFAERMIFPYEPSMIVLRAGGNDINAGWSADDVFEDYKAFVTKIRSRLPAVPIVYVGLSPTIKRVAQIDVGNQLNDKIVGFCKSNTGLHFIDTSKSTLGTDGKPRADLFVADMLHFNEAGYRLLTGLVRPVLLKLAGKP